MKSVSIFKKFLKNIHFLVYELPLLNIIVVLVFKGCVFFFIFFF